MRILCIGTYDLGKPRTRIFLRLLKRIHQTEEIHSDIWQNIEDKSQLSSFKQVFEVLYRYVSTYPSLIAKLIKVRKVDIVCIPYMGHIDVLILGVFAKLLGYPLIWDAFISIFDTVVSDRKLCKANGIVAGATYFIEHIACSLSDRVLMDTNAHSKYIATTYRTSKNKVKHFYVGAEQENFPALPPRKRNHESQMEVLFYGQFIPLHGIETIVKSAALTSHLPINWKVIGKGQESERISKLINEYENLRLEWIQWVQYPQLIEHIQAADVCLGIFGTSGKASRVIPNKVFQIISSGRNLITRDSPAIREILDPDTKGIKLINEGNPQELAAAVSFFLQETNLIVQEQLADVFSEKVITQQISSVIKSIDIFDSKRSCI